MNPLFQGATCLPQHAAAGGTCDFGGLPQKTLKITTVAQVQLAVNFARNTGIRLIVHNTGHDYLGKSVGAGALSIWTNNLKSIDFIPAYSSASSSYAGPAMRLGAGVEVYELYEAANKYGVSALGGECQVNRADMSRSEQCANVNTDCRCCWWIRRRWWPLTSEF
jgi:FAD/FMN-containing dehydrogenase